MFRTSLANALVHRTCKPLHERHQATPVVCYLDPNQTQIVYSGMVMAKTGANTVALADGDSARPFGLAALDYNPTINDLDGLSDLKLFAVWQGGPDAYFQIDSPAFFAADSTGYATPGMPLYVGDGDNSSGVGQIMSTDPDGTYKQPIGELIELVSSTRIIVRIDLPVALAT